LEKISKSPGVFDYKKLDWYNGQYIRNKKDSELAALLLPYMKEAGLTEDINRILTIVPLVKERLKTLSDVVPMVSYLFKEPDSPAPEDMIFKKQTREKTLECLEKAYPIVKTGLDNSKTDEEIETELCNLASSLEVKVNGVFMPIRISVTGSTVSPPLFDYIRLLGKEKTYSRIERAIKILRG